MNRLEFREKTRGWMTLALPSPKFQVLKERSSGDCWNLEDRTTRIWIDYYSAGLRPLNGFFIPALSSTIKVPNQEVNPS